MGIGFQRGCWCRPMNVPARAWLCHRQNQCREGSGVLARLSTPWPWIAGSVGAPRDAPKFPYRLSLIRTSAKGPRSQNGSCRSIACPRVAYGGINPMLTAFYSRPDFSPAPNIGGRLGPVDRATSQPYTRWPRPSVRQSSVNVTIISGGYDFDAKDRNPHSPKLSEAMIQSSLIF